MIKPDIVLYGTRDNMEELLSNIAENIIFAILLARKAGYTDLRIVDYTDMPVEYPDFLSTIQKG
jgi:hypothetical protein